MNGKQLQIQVTKQMLCDALLRLLERKNFNDISVEDIIKESQTSRRTFYRHYRNKMDLLNFYFKQLMEEYLNFKETGTSQQHQPQALLSSLQFWYSKRRQIKSVIDNCLFEALIIHWNTNAAEIAERLYGAGKQSEEELYALSFFIGGYCNALWFWLGKAELETPEIVAAYFSKILSKLDFKE